MINEVKKPVTVVGYLYINVQSFSVPSINTDISCHISLGVVARCNTNPLPSGTPVNQVFLIEVPQDPSRLVIELKEGEKMIGDCRYDVNPFFNHPGAAHSINSDIFNNDNENKGSVNLKITFYSAEHGRLKLRVFHLQLNPQFAEQFKTARLKAKSSIYVQNSNQWQINTPFDHDYELLVLLKTGNLEFEVVCSQGILAQYSIHNLQTSGVLNKETKAYQVSLFNKDKAVGLIKYQITWVQN